MSMFSRISCTFVVTASLLGCSSMLASSASLQGHWSLREIRGSQTLALSDTDALFTLSIGENQRAHGKVACNGWHAQVLQEGNTFRLNATGSTRMRCVIKDSALRSLEKRYLPALQTPATYTVSDSELRLQLGSGETWIFTRQQP